MLNCMPIVKMSGNRFQYQRRVYIDFIGWHLRYSEKIRLYMYIKHKIEQYFMGLVSMITYFSYMYMPLMV